MPRFWCVTWAEAKVGHAEPLAEVHLIAEHGETSLALLPVGGRQVDELTAATRHHVRRVAARLWRKTSAHARLCQYILLIIIDV